MKLALCDASSLPVAIVDVYGRHPRRACSCTVYPIEAFVKHLRQAPFLLVRRRNEHFEPVGFEFLDNRDIGLPK
ncbi:hypothetical protein AcW1_002882 [Taiwanofungus camphoratus]|nr:hypothetical protein AcW1_002882 [Antrodia cinnamomea]